MFSGRFNAIMLDTIMAKIAIVPFAWIIFSIVIIVLALRSIRYSITENRKIRALGHHAPEYKFRLPWGIDFFYFSIIALRQRQMFKLWRK